MTTIVSPPVLPGSPLAPVPPADPVAPVSPVLPTAPVSPVAPAEPVGPVWPLEPVAPVGPAGPGTVTTAGTTTVGCFSHALNVNATSTAERTIEFFIIIPRDYRIESKHHTHWRLFDHREPAPDTTPGHGWLPFGTAQRVVVIYTFWAKAYLPGLSTSSSRPASPRPRFRSFRRSAAGAGGSAADGKALGGRGGWALGSARFGEGAARGSPLAS